MDPDNKKFYLAEFRPPRQFLMGKMGEEEIFADCADCDQRDAIMGGCVTSENGKVALLKNETTGSIKNAVFCCCCFEKRLEASGEALGNA